MKQSTIASFNVGTLPDFTIGGGLALGVIGSPYSGSLDDVRVYNRALSAGEVLQLYNLGR